MDELDKKFSIFAVIGGIIVGAIAFIFGTKKPEKEKEIPTVRLIEREEK